MSKKVFIFSVILFLYHQTTLTSQADSSNAQSSQHEQDDSDSFVNVHTESDIKKKWQTAASKTLARERTNMKLPVLLAGYKAKLTHMEQQEREHQKHMRTSVIKNKWQTFVHKKLEKEKKDIILSLLQAGHKAKLTHETHKLLKQLMEKEQENLVSHDTLSEQHEREKASYEAQIAQLKKESSERAAKISQLEQAQAQKNAQCAIAESFITTLQDHLASAMRGQFKGSLAYNKQANFKQQKKK